MKQQTDGTTLLTKAEYLSLAKLVSACHEAISSLSNDGDFLGWDNYRALQMWDEKLLGKNQFLLDDFMGNPKDKGKAKTVDQWLDTYGRRRKERGY